MPPEVVEKLVITYGFGKFFFQHTTDLLCVLDKNFVMVQANPSWQKSGYAPDSLVGTNFLDYSIEGEREYLKNLFTEKLQERCPFFEVKSRFQFNNQLHSRLKFMASAQDGSYIYLISKNDLSTDVKDTGLIDPLTNLPNRNLLIERTKLALANAKRDNKKVAFHFVDLNKFKPINDTYGHDVGDHVLKIVGERLQQCVRDMDTAARVGGDEFVIVQHGLRQGIHATLMAKRLITSLSQPISIGDDINVKVGASVGISIFPDHGEDIFELINYADETMYRVKKAGREGYQFYKLNTLSS